MLIRLRAVMAVGLLAGFYIVVAITVLGLFPVGRGIGGPLGQLAVMVALVVGVAVVVSLVRVTRHRPRDPAGVSLTHDQAPQLWDEVRDLAAKVGTHPPDRILLVPIVNASVHERTRMLGLVGGYRTLLVGLPLLQAFTVDQLRAVLAHEMGHYSHSHTRLAAVTYRGRDALGAIIAHVGPRNLVGLLFRSYARLYFLVEAAVSRRQEVEADRAAARIAGRDATTRVLGDLTGLAAAWDFYLDRYLAPGRRHGYLPEPAFGGFAELLRASGELVRLRSTARERGHSRYDTHPPIAERIALVATMPEDHATADDRPATSLVTRLDEVTGLLEDMAIGREGTMPVRWEEYLELTADAEHRDRADALLTAFAARAGRPSASANDMIDALGTPEYADFLRSVQPAAAEAGPGAGIAPLLLVAMACATHSGAARWRASWPEGSVVLVGTDGRPLDLEGVVTRLTDPATTMQARAELSALGIRLDLTAEATTSAPSRPVGAVANVVVNGTRRDLVIYDTGLLIIPPARRGRMHMAVKRLEALPASAGLDELRSSPDSRFVPYQDVVTCERTGITWQARMFTLLGAMGTTSGGDAFAFAATLLDGSVVRVRWGTETVFLGSSAAVLNRVVDTLVAGRESVAAEPVTTR